MSDRYTQLLSEVNRNSHVVETVQLAPFTYVKMKCKLEDNEYIGIGFAKKSPDDDWCKNHGIDVAKAKAIGHIMFQIMQAESIGSLCRAVEQSNIVEQAMNDLEAANQKIADMMDVVKEAVNEAGKKVEVHHVGPSSFLDGDEGVPKPESSVAIGHSELVNLSAPNEALAQKLLNLAGRFGDSSKGTGNTSVRLFLNPCYDKREVLDWLRRQMRKESLSMEIQADAAEFESKLDKAQAKMDEADAASGRERRMDKDDLRRVFQPVPKESERDQWFTGTDRWTFIGSVSKL